MLYLARVCVRVKGGGRRCVVEVAAAVGAYQEQRERVSDTTRRMHIASSLVCAQWALLAMLVARTRRE